MKKETLKEAAKIFYPPKTTDLICSPELVRDAFEAGAKWQQEQLLKFIWNKDNHTEGELGNSCIDVQTLVNFYVDAYT